MNFMMDRSEVELVTDRIKSKFLTQSTFRIGIEVQDEIDTHHTELLSIPGPIG